MGSDARYPTPDARYFKSCRYLEITKVNPPNTVNAPRNVIIYSKVTSVLSPKSKLQ